jgi:spore coat polysaccharide biosynthesis protein SpsF (cytidylyltransferase family)
MSNRYAFIIQARSGSTRLPNKILLPFYEHKTILDLQLENIRESFPDVLIILATTVNKADDVIADKYTKWNGVNVYRGDENNVLKRFIDAAKSFGVENIVRICSDNPFLSMSYCTFMIDEYFKARADYVSFSFNNGTPAIRSHSGLFAEMVSLKALEKVMQSTTEALFMEHVTNYIYSHSGDFKLEFIPVPKFIDNYIDKLRLTIDTQVDFINLQKLYLAVLKKYGYKFTVEQLMAEVEANTELVKLMSEQIRQYAK